MKTMALTLLSFLLASVAWTQTQNQGAIVGAVTDPTGAVVAGAKVVVINTKTAISASSTSDARGDYRFSFLAPGEYLLNAEAQGFSKTAVESVTVEVGTTTRTDIRLQLGKTTEEVTVTSNAPLVNTENAERGDVVMSEQIQHLPLNGREFLQLAVLEPGAVNGNPKLAVEPSRGGVDVSFNGARSTTNSFYVNGAASNDPLYNTLASSPALDAIAEFQVMTNMYSAQYGRSGGAVISVVTKSGDNHFHGTAYEYHRNKVLDALPYFFTGPRNTLSNYLFNQYGGTIGGPIIKKKTFFFFSGEAFHEVKPGQLIVSFAPTAAERNGDVSKTINPNSGKPVVLTNPYTQQPIPGNVLPASLINPIGKFLMSLWPEPNFSGDPFLNRHDFRGGLYKQRKYLTRIDHHFSAKDAIMGTWDINNYDNTSSVSNTIYGDKLLADHTTTYAGNWTHTFTPRLMNDFKFSGSSLLSGDQFALTDGGKNFCAKWGFDPNINTVPGTCRILLYTVGFQRFDIGNDGNFSHHNNSIYAKDNLAWVKGTHTFTFGGEYTRDMYNWQYENGLTAYYFGLNEGVAGLDPVYNVTGSTFTDVLVGISNRQKVGIGGTANAGPSDMHLLRSIYSAYADDSWKIKPWLTLTVGLRYDYEEPFADTDNEFMTLDYKTGLPLYAKGAPANLLKLVQFKYETGGPNRPYYPNWLNFAPRVGFALRPLGNNDTVVRGGYGIFYTTETAYTTMYGSWVSPFQGQVSITPGNAAGWPDGQRHLQTVDQTPFGIAFKQGTDPGTFFANAPYYPTGYVQQYNLTVGRSISSNWATEVGYVGSHAVNLNGALSTQTYDPNLYKETVANGFSNFSLRAKGFNSHYDALQVTVKHAPAHGFNLLTSYTWSHALAQASNDGGLENLLVDVNATGNIIQKLWSNADFDVRQRLSVSGGYELPFGKGKAFGSHWNSVANGVLGGWRSNFIYTFQSGFPFTVYTSGLAFPDRTCSGVLPSDQRSPRHWFDSTCFPTHTPTTFVDPVTGKSTLINVQGNSRPNIMVGPHTNDTDFGMEKYFHITEGQTLQFRIEAFNVFNHPNLLGPSGNYFFNSPSGTAITRAKDARDIQIAVRYAF
jgi:hypothetical protein